MVYFHLGSRVLDEESKAEEWVSESVVEEVFVHISRSTEKGFFGEERCSRSLVSTDTTRDIEGLTAGAA
jgi:hypothetical protein